MSKLESATVTSPPGATIRDLLEERGITTEDFAPRIGLDPRRMQDLLDGSLLLGKKLSRRLAYQLGSTPEFWLQRESNYRASISAVINGKMPTVEEATQELTNDGVDIPAFLERANAAVDEAKRRGGKRKGAGRPTGTTRGPSTPAQIRRAARKGTARGRVPRISDGVNCTVRLPAELVALLDAQAEASEVSATRADAIRDHLAWSIANRPGFMNKKT